MSETDLHIVDSSGWIEFLSDGPGADTFRSMISRPDDLVVPAVTVYETVRWALVSADVNRAQRVAVTMRRSRVIDLDADLAVAAASLSRLHGLAMADSIIYATAQRFDATLWTQDADFETLPGVRYFPKLTRP
nr:type II toxin-antitoxin system VapC family toxin [Polymorphobacter sp.]